MKKPKSTAPAFSLIELLAVIVVVGILVSITIPVIGHMRQKADSTNCAANLRQIGIALNLYINDNDSRLPGPFYTVQGPYYTGTFRSLANSLGPYLAVINVSDTKQKSLSFVCPAWERQMRGNENALYPFTLNLDPKYPDGTKWSTSAQPFGDANSQSKQPQTMPDLAQYPLAQTWMLSELDRERSNRSDPMPETRVHGNHRNELYYDLHIERSTR